MLQYKIGKKIEKKIENKIEKKMKKTDTIKYSDFYNKINILHSTAKDFTGALCFLCDNMKRCDAVTYKRYDKFAILGKVCNIDDGGKCFYEYSPMRDGEISDTISVSEITKTHSKVEVSYYIDGVKYKPEEINDFIYISAPYTAFIIRLTFQEKPDVNAEFEISSRTILLNTEARIKLTESTVLTKNNVYENGICARLQ